MQADRRGPGAPTTHLVAEASDGRLSLSQLSGTSAPRPSPPLLSRTESPEAVRPQPEALCRPRHLSPAR